MESAVVTKFRFRNKFKVKAIFVVVAVKITTPFPYAKRSLYRTTTVVAIAVCRVKRCCTKFFAYAVYHHNPAKSSAQLHSCNDILRLAGSKELRPADDEDEARVNLECGKCS